jgi:hypothetical protein
MEEAEPVGALSGAESLALQNLLRREAVNV